MRFVRETRRGNYMMTMGAMLPILVGFAALSVDISYISMSQMQAQHAADAAAHAAFVAYRARGNDTAIGEDAAAYLVTRNQVGGASGALVDLQFGEWDFDTFAFSAGSTFVNAAQARVSRSEVQGNPLDLFFAPLLGYSQWDVSGYGITAGRSRQVIIVQDVSCSFADDIHNARDANIAFLNYLAENPYPDDRLGMTLFGGRVWYPPLQELAPVVGNYDTAGSGPDGKPNGMLQRFEALDYCSDLPDWSEPWPSTYNPACYTTQARGLIQAAEQFATRGDSRQFQAVILVSDGLPNHGLQKSGDTGRKDTERAIAQLWGRDEDGEDARWWSFDAYECEDRFGPSCDAPADRSYTTYFDGGVHVWTVTFQNGEGDFDWMGTLTRGMGRAYLTPNPEELTEIMIEIASSIPVVLTE